MKIKATILSENSVFSNLGAIAEHGWSVHLETEYGHFLFDTGQGKALLNNMHVFKKDWSAIKGILISHHHVDHTGGLMVALNEIKTKPVDVYAHPDLFKEGYLIRSGYTYIGIPFTKESLEVNGARFIYNTEFTEIYPDFYLTGEVPRKTEYETGDTDIVIKTESGYVPYPVADDQSIVIKTEKGLFIILGCSHAGIINILNYAVLKTGESRIHTVIGGTHLWSVSERQKEESIRALKEMKVERIGVSHCTGFEVSMRLAREFGDQFFLCHVGTVVEA
ncbi:MAG: beta-lactamase protein [Paenibacillus sp.]|jgi:7,8-dihydropterin-6-yl-methyl-4-(beta-D-ribofuranosyl)aminobenzene 5'-phosphate synthase|nr:beta-lactamase protein [Paenibacillus sp.]